MSIDDTCKGVLCGVFAEIFYGMNPLFTLPLYKMGMQTGSVLFYRYFFAFCFFGIIALFRKKSFCLTWKQLFQMILCGFLGAGSSLTLFLSYLYMDAGLASTILFIYPVIVAVIMAGFFQEKLSPVTLAGIAGTLGGICILHGGFGDGEPLSLAGLLLVLASALTFALYLIVLRVLSIRELPPSVLNFYSMMFGIPLFLIPALSGSGLQMIPSPGAWGCILALVLLPTVFSFLLIAYSVRLIGATPTAVLGALEPLTAIFFGVLLFHEKLNISRVCGIILILLSVSVVIAKKPFFLLVEKVSRPIRTVFRKP